MSRAQHLVVIKQSAASRNAEAIGVVCRCTPYTRTHTTCNIKRFSTIFLYKTYDFLLNLVKDHLVTWLLQSGMDYLLISDFRPLSTPSNVVWKLIFSNSPSTPLPCCPPSDCQRLWFSTTTECARFINACIIITLNPVQWLLLAAFSHC